MTSRSKCESGRLAHLVCFSVDLPALALCHQLLSTVHVTLGAGAFFCCLVLPALGAPVRDVVAQRVGLQTK